MTIKVGEKVTYIGRVLAYGDPGWRYQRYTAVVTKVKNGLVDLRFAMRDRATGRMVQVRAYEVPPAKDRFDPPKHSFIMPRQDEGAQP